MYIYTVMHIYMYIYLHTHTHKTQDADRRNLHAQASQGCSNQLYPY